MKKILAACGAGFVIVAGFTSAARADTATYNISGTFGEAVNTCFNIAVLLTGTDCSYARTRSPALTTYSGPKLAGAFYPRGSAGDNVNFTPVPGDTKLDVPVTGTITIDDNGTPANGADDLISATWVLGAAAHNATTGSGDRAVERWDSFTHVMAPTPVNSATASGAGFEYVIGARGKPTPILLCAAGSSTDCFPSENAPEATASPGFWDATFSAVTPTSARVGIARTPTFGAAGPGNPLIPNTGGQTTGTFTGYQCLDNIGDNDCITSEFLFGASLTIYRNENGTTSYHPELGDCNDAVDNDGDTSIDGADPQCVPIAPSQPTGQTTVQVSPPGFENVVLVLTTDGAGNITIANAFWTREYVILAGPSGGTDPPGIYTIDNSWAGGRINFSGEVSRDAPTAVDDTASVTEDTATNVVVLANDTRGGEPNVVSVEAGQQPPHGTVVVNPDGESFTYTPDTHYSGTDTFQYRVTDNDGDFSVGTVNLTVSERVPVAGTFNTSSSGGNPTAAIPVLNNPTVLGTGTAGEHTVSVTGLATGGTCAVVGSAVSFVPAAGFNNAVGSCEYRVTDADGDSDTGELRATVTGNFGTGREARDDSATTATGTPVAIALMANDIGFSDPVIVDLWSPPAHGTVIISGSPGPGAQILATYTPAPGFVGDDYFEYVVDDQVDVDFATVTVAVFADPDGDGVGPTADNCLAANNPDQRDTDADGYGNRCDADFNNSGSVNAADLAIFRTRFGSPDPHADLDGNGIVNFADLATFRTLFGAPPGPSGLACAGTVPCGTE